MQTENNFLTYKKRLECVLNMFYFVIFCHLAKGLINTLLRTQMSRYVAIELLSLTKMYKPNEKLY